MDAVITAQALQPTASCFMMGLCGSESLAFVLKTQLRTLYRRMYYRGLDRYSNTMFGGSLL